MRPTLFKHRRRYGGATPAVGLRRGCDQSKHTFNYHSAELMRNYGSGFHESRWLQCLWRQHPAPEVAALGVSVPLTGCASLKQILSILSEESCWRENSFIPISSVHRSLELPFGAADFKSQLSNKRFSIYRLFTRNASMNSNYYHLELSIIQEAHHDHKPQSSESRKIRGEADAISTQDRFSKFEFSHLFLRCWPVLASPTPGEQKRWRLFSIWTAIIQPKSSMYTSKTNLFSRRSQRKPLQAARMSFEQAKVIYVLFLPFSFIYLNSKYSRRNTLIVRVVNTRRFNSGYTCCNYYLFFRRNRSLV